MSGGLAVNLLIAMSALTRLALPGLVGGMAAFASGGDAQLPACTDDATLAAVQEQYVTAEASLGSPRIPALRDVAETDGSESSARFCRAELVLDNGDTDTLFWRLDDVRDAERREAGTDHCSLRHDGSGNGCAGWQPGEPAPARS